VNKPVLALTDFGSTYTKVALVNSTTGDLLATAQAPTTVHNDVMVGYRNAVNRACSVANIPAAQVTSIASSSAGGGLSVGSIGLVDDYTAAAARQAALNSGAKVDLVISGHLDTEKLNIINKTNMDVLLFSGGTDGGHTKQVIANAKLIAGAIKPCPIIIACNKDISDVVATIFCDTGFEVTTTENVLPDIDTMNIDPARRAINKLFIERVIIGKGLSDAVEFSNTVIMPTPEAVLVATELLSKGTALQQGVGDILVIDIGGATTDIHSSLSKPPTRTGFRSRGPGLPTLMRSVQGDLGMRWNASSVCSQDEVWLKSILDLGTVSWRQVTNICEEWELQPHRVLTDKSIDSLIEPLLAISCAAIAIERHCGKTSAVYIPNQGVDLIQDGADFREIPLVVGTGGILIHNSDGTGVLERALRRQKAGHTLSPTNARAQIDSHYIMAAAGLLSTQNPDAALHLMRSSLQL
jgi:uncharacterized protein (TIGR01319 family)